MQTLRIDEKLVREAWAETRAEALAALRPGERCMNWCAHVDLPPNPTSATPDYDAKGFMVMFSIDRSASGELRVTHNDVVLEPAPAAASTEIPITKDDLRTVVALTRKNAQMVAALQAFAGDLSKWKDEHHDCDCPPHSSCGCHELRTIIQQMESFSQESSASHAPEPTP